MNFIRRAPRHKRLDVKFALIIVKLQMAMSEFADNTNTPGPGVEACFDIIKDKDSSCHLDFIADSDAVQHCCVQLTFKDLRSERN